METRPATAPAAPTGGDDVWAAVTHIFADMDAQGGIEEEEGVAVEETLQELRGLLDMHQQLERKKVALAATKVQATRERDAALERLAELGIPLSTLGNERTSETRAEPQNASE
jgi:hypothetical protein